VVSNWKIAGAHRQVLKSLQARQVSRYPAGSMLKLNTFVRVLSIATLSITGTVGVLSAQRDPGVRAGAPGAGGPIKNLTKGELDFFNIQGVEDFVQVEDVPNNGLGPRFNLDSCGGCHAHPATGGSSPFINPQVARAATMAPPPANKIPAFLSLTGPIREARFVKNPDGTRDGGVHDLFVITGRADAPAACILQQPDFAQELAKHNVIFRIPTPLFGDGLIEAINDTTLRQSLASDPDRRKAFFGITGRFNTNGNDGTITRFGWKAQNKSLEIFAGEAYNVEMGLTNEVFQTEREENPNCAKLVTPNTDFTFNQGGTVVTSDVVNFRGFMRFLAPPTPACVGAACSASIQNGSNLFVQAGCATCHTPTLMTGNDGTAALRHQPVNLFSDLAIHNMGEGLADGVRQGVARENEFRTAPLWGLGQRIFFLHDGRTKDLMEAIHDHASQGSEANRVINTFNDLRDGQKQDILNFLRSL
jgi:cytochrome c553